MKPIIDSKMTFEEAVKGTSAPQDVLSQMVLLDVQYYSYDDNLHQGQIMVNKTIEKDIKKIFAKIKKLKFPIAKCIPMSYYNWDDVASMEDNNSSAFCYRYIAGTTKVSNHSFGLAFDLNPKYNPAIHPTGEVEPLSGTFDVERPGTLTDNSELARYIVSLDYTWGRYFTRFKDIQHFEKNLTKKGA